MGLLRYLTSHMWIQRVIRTVVFCIWISGIAGQDCVWRSSISATLPDTQLVRPLPECLEGDSQLLWNNPRGMLIANFTKDGLQKNFTLCFAVHNGNATLAGVYDVSTGSPVPVDEYYYEYDPPCVKSVNDAVVLRFDANDELESLAMISYFKQPP